MSLIFRNFMGVYKPYIAMTNQDKKANLTPEQEEINRLRGEVHNLKRQVKRLKRERPGPQGRAEGGTEGLEEGQAAAGQSGNHGSGYGGSQKKKLVEEGFGERKRKSFYP